MSDIFISYASEDRSRAETLAKALEEQGWSVWWDRTIPPGKTFDQVIEEAINTARCVIVLWSKRSIKSNWVKEEANIGKQRNILVPAKIDPVDPPLGFGRIQAADLTYWEAEKSHPEFFSFLKAISEIAGPPPERDKSVQDTKLPESNLEQQLKVRSKESETFQPDLSHLKPVEKESPITGPKAPRKKRLVLGIGAAALILVLIVIGWFLLSKPALYTITASSDPNGSISPPGSVTVTHGESKTFTITPSQGHHIADVVVDGESKGAEPRYPFKNVTGDHTISASFAVKSYKITPSSDPNGRISPPHPVKVDHGKSRTFKITPKPGYRVEDVKVDGRSVGAVSSYPFNDVIGDQTISATFEKIMASSSYTIKALSDPNGSISPPGSVPVTQGESKAFEITPNKGYRIGDVKVDGRSVGATSSYGFKNVTSDHMIEASFKRLPPPYERFAFNPQRRILRIPSANVHNPRNQITLEAWFNTKALGTRQAIITKLHPEFKSREPYYQYNLELRQTGQLYFAMAINGVRRYIDGAFRVYRNKWYHVAATYDGNIMRLYLNGQEWGKPYTKKGTLSVYGEPLVIGGEPSDRPFKGQLAEARIWNVARTADQIRAAMDKTIPPTEGLAFSSTNELFQ